ncbi:DUF6531 domain-containing protein [Streptomyces sp. DSM 44917]|uniref:DUF6531 domain-containing protein n=1 Tax=Streptomyces boetiae TaxID=3075541 RepID=A0ABU2L1P8_9ACTN|nr:DUF6531 domain-containing protein [Streptomyces sp. DSM 44917]MDT0305427.1 DUF6531 domain-containing protein [Streptomyces sp. DSM 44917]
MSRPSDWSPVDMDRDPTPGDPEEIRQLATELQEFADDVGEALGRVRGMASDRAVQEWSGLSADTFRAEFDGVPENLDKLQRSYDLAADALAAYWPELQNAQGMADRALQRAVEAQAALASAQTELTDAQGWVSRAGDEAERLQDERSSGDGDGGDAPEPPDENQVRQAVRDHQAAQEAASAARSRVDSAESELSAARELARQAQEMREEAARLCAQGLEEASDAGIQNRSWWERLLDFLADAWDAIVAVCKVIVAVLGVVALIIGGPLAFVVLAAAVVVLADTLIEYANGRGSLLDVAFAALDCIPGMRGLTTLGGLARGLRGGLSAARTGLRGIAQGVRGLGQNIRRMGRDVRGLSLCGDPVDMATGELVVSATDVDLPGVLPLILERHHRTGVRTGLLFGPSWASTLDQRLVLAEHGVELFTADGRVLHYPVPLAEGGGVLPVEGPHWPLAWDGGPGGELAVRQGDSGLTLRFRPVPGRPASTLPLAAISDRNGNAVTLVHGPDGLPAEVVHDGGYRIGLATTSEGRITALRLLSDPGQPTLLRFGYDERGNLAEVVNSSGEPLRFAYDARHRITGWEDRNGSWYRYVYDEEGRCVATQGAGGVLDYAFAYAADPATGGPVTTAADSLGHTRTFRFNDCYQLVEETDPLGHAVRQEWDRRDLLLAHTDELGRTTRLEWDEAGRLTAVTLPDGSTTRARYDESGLPVEVTDFAGAVRRQEWDERGNCTALTEPTGATTRFTHDPTGALATLTDATGAVQRFTNNAAGLPVRSLDPVGAEVLLEYDAFGRVTAETDPLGGTTRLTWSVEGRMLSRTLPDGSAESWTYDAEGNRLTHTDPLGRTTAWEYAPFDQVTARTTPDGARLTFAHDTELRLTGVTNAEGATWTYTLDAAGQPVAETDFDGRTLAYAYDAAGQLTRRVNALGQTVEFAYDAAGRQVRKSVDGQVTVFTHDPAGRLLTAEGPGVSLALAYDAAGNTTAETINGRTLHTTYDLLGRPAGRTTPAGVAASYAYDAAGRRTALAFAGRTLTSTWDASGRETRRELGPGGPVLAHSWDAADRLTAQTATMPGAERPALGRTFDLRADGSLATVEDRRTGRRSYEADAAGRVTGVRAADWSESYAWDASGNQTAAAWPEDRPEPSARGSRTYEGTRVTRAGAVSYAYDAAGRVVLRRRARLSRKPEVWRYTWDAEDRLTSVTTPDGTRWRYLYDAFGRRVAKQRLAPDGETVAEQTEFTWDGIHLVEQTTTVAGQPEAVTLTWEREETRPLAQAERRSLADAPQQVVDQRFFAIVTDLVGTPTELLAEDGSIAWHAAGATLWGLIPPPPSAAAHTPLRFPGQYADEETRLHYNLLRHYDPLTARYVTPDPLGLDAGPNARAYVPDPLFWIDYLGLLTCAQHAARLRRNLARAGRPVGPGQAAAHIVPTGFNRGGAPAMRRLLQRYGVDINDAANGIPLGHPTPHNFTHRNAYLGRLDARLQQVVQNGINQGLGRGAIRQSLRRELRSIGRQIERELSTGAPGPGAYWTA